MIRTALQAESPAGKRRTGRSAVLAKKIPLAFLVSEDLRMKKTPAMPVERINLRVQYRYGPWRFWANGLNLTDTLEDRASYSRGQLKYRTVDGRTWYTGLSYHF